MSTTNYLDTKTNYLEPKKGYQEVKENYLKATKLSKCHSELVPAFDEKCFFTYFFLKKRKIGLAERIS